jgi:CTP:molybdopterin cytidylyltransferase MocA
MASVYEGPMSAPSSTSGAVAGLILAAGASTRFGAPKQLVRMGERTMLEAVVGIAQAAGLEPVLVVVPPRMAVPPRAVPVLNDRPELGLSHSLRSGIAAVPAEVDAVAILLGDQPGLDPQVVRGILAARGDQPMVATAANGLVGPPVLLERRRFDLVETLSGDIGLREVIRADADVRLIEVDAHPADVDTPEDLAALAGGALPSVEELAARRGELRRRLLARADAGGEQREGWGVPLVVAHLARWDRVGA